MQHLQAHYRSRRRLWHHAHPLCAAQLRCLRQRQQYAPHLCCPCCRCCFCLLHGCCRLKARLSAQCIMHKVAYICHVSCAGGVYLCPSSCRHGCVGLGADLVVRDGSAASAWAVGAGRHATRLAHRDAHLHEREGAETVLFSHVSINAIFLPRQARDKHRENSNKVPFSCLERQASRLRLPHIGLPRGDSRVP